ncbi:MAG: protein kinase [Phycisphaerae bacterium]|nr:serine/threonine protein kinase [Phycisphaerae bacterium]NUQ47536.1 protein kinase [Phycisphaerae bacterium]
MSRCPSIDVLERAVLGAHAAAAPLRRHVDDCPRCRERARHIRENAALLDDVRAVGAASLTDCLDAAAAPGATPRRAVADAAPDGYEILHELHRGGQGVVYLARHKATHRTVALKMLLQGAFATSRQRRRFEREIELAAALRHPHIVTIFDSGTTPDGRHYFAMEFIEGPPLDRFLARRRHGVAAGDLLESRLRLFLKLCDAVNHAHQRGVIHRDLKPANILVDAAGEPHVLDFGLAKALGDGALTASADVTRAGEFMGTFAYAAPEQLAGDPNQIDTRTDVYALGVLLYQILTDALPFRVSGSLSEALHHIAEGDPRPPIEVAPLIGDELNTIVLKALSRERDRRYQSAAALQRDIEAHLSGEPIDAKRDSRWYVLRKTARRFRAPLGVAAAFLVIVSAAVVCLALLAGRLTRERDRALEAERRAEDHTRTLALALSTSNIERGRSAGRAGNAALAEELIWREYLLTLPLSTADERPATAPHNAANDCEPDFRLVWDSPTRTHAYWALWELYSAMPCRRSWCVQRGEVLNARFTSDGRSIITVGENGAVVFRDAETGNTRGICREPTSALSGACFARRDLLALATDATLEIWRLGDDVASSHLAAVAPLPHARVAALDFTELGDAVATAGTEGGLALWRFETEQLPQFHAPLNFAPSSMCFSPDGDSLLIGDASGYVYRYRLDAWACDRVIAAHDGETRCLVFDRRGTTLVTAGNDNMVRLWDWPALTVRRVLRGHRGHLISCGFNAGGDLLATTSNDRRVILWNAVTGEMLAAYAGHARNVSALRFHPSRPLLMAAGSDLVRLWDLRPNAALVTRSEGPGTVFAVGFSPDGRTLASGGESLFVSLWNVQSQTLSSRLAGHQALISDVAFSPDGRLLASASYDRTVRIWDAGSGECIRVLGDHKRTVSGVAFDVDGTRLASCGEDGETRIWSVADGSCRMRLPSRFWRCSDVTYSPDDRELAACDAYSEISLWDVSTGERRCSLRGHDGQARCVSYSPDGSLLASGGDDWLVRLWDPHAGSAVGVLEGCQDDVFSLTFSADGRMLIAGTRGGHIVMWDVESRRVLATLDTPHQMVFSVALRQDGRELASGGHDGTVGFWDLTYYSSHIAGNMAYQRALIECEP